MTGGDNKLIMGAFLGQFRELCADLDIVFKDDVDVRSATTAMRTLLSANPKLVVTTYHERVTVPYGAEFERGNSTFFLRKDYTNDIQMENASGILSKINSLREPISRLEPECQSKVMKYFNNLSRLSTMLFAKS